MTWIVALDRFLRENGLRTFDLEPIKAALRELKLPVDRTLDAYLSIPAHKVMAVSRSKKTVEIHPFVNRALDSCARRAKGPCRILLRDLELVREP